jgi:CubicO group peptidase (beta-lactamase class C family)
VQVICCGAREGGLVKRKFILSILALSTLGFTTEARPQEPVTPMEKKIGAIFSGAISPDAPGVAVLVRKNGRAVFERGYGVRDLRTKTKIDAHSNFRLASSTKQFTAMAILLLVHDGKLRYDQTLAEFFPDFPAYGKTITIRNLLNHTSGLPEYEDLMDSAEKTKGPVWSPEHQIQDDEVLALLKQEKNGKFAPGTSWSYSNSGYVVLGLVVAKVSGKSYGEFLQERILRRSK